jgi:hypothetical protein
MFVIAIGISDNFGATVPTRRSRLFVGREKRSKDRHGAKRHGLHRGSGYVIVTGRCQAADTHGEQSPDGEASKCYVAWLQRYGLAVLDVLLPVAISML